MVGGPVAPRSRTLCLLGALASLTLTASPRAGTSAEWPCFHGPRRDNKSTETGLLKPWPNEGPALLWTHPGLGKGYSSVTLAGGLLYTAGMVEKQTYVIALDLDGNGRPGGSPERCAPTRIPSTSPRGSPG